MRTGKRTSKKNKNQILKSFTTKWGYRKEIHTFSFLKVNHFLNEVLIWEGMPATDNIVLNYPRHVAERAGSQGNVFFYIVLEII